MIILLIIVLSLLLYFLGLIYITKNMFEKANIKLPVLGLIFIPLFILKIHISIAYDWKDNRKKVAFVMKNFFLGYNLALIIFVELLTASLKKTVKENKKEKKNIFSYFRDREFFSSVGSNKKEYHDSLVEYCM